jgi:hypothetical protein
MSRSVNYSSDQKGVIELISGTSLRGCEFSYSRRDEAPRPKGLRTRLPFWSFGSSHGEPGDFCESPHHPDRTEKRAGAISLALAAITPEVTISRTFVRHFVLIWAEFKSAELCTN